MTNSRQKGKRGELEVAHLLKEFGYEARRSQQYAGINSDADVVGVDGLHIEVKLREALNIDDALEQAVNDHKAGEIPVVFHRKNHKRWKVTLYAEQFMEIWKALDDFIRSRDEQGRMDKDSQEHTG